MIKQGADMLNLTTPPAWARTENALNAAAIQMRNSGQNAVWSIDGKARTIREWLSSEFERNGLDKSKMASL